MRILLLLIVALYLGACSEPLNKGQYTPLPTNVHTFQMDSTDAGVLLNATGMVVTGDYLVISSLNKDTIFDVFDVNKLNHLYSGLVYGQGGNDMLPFRWMRPLADNRFYTVGLGVPVITVIEAGNRLEISGRNKLEWEKDICQNLYPLKDGKMLIQPGKKQGEWSLYNVMAGKIVDMPDFPFKEYEPDYDWMETFQNKAAHVAVNTAKERIAFFYCKFPYMQLFDFEGNVLYESCVGEHITDPLKFFRKDEMYYSGCTYTDEFVFVKYLPAQAEADKTYFQVWDWEGNLLSLFEIEDRINLFAVSPDGRRMYAAKNDNDHIFWCDISFH